MRRTLGLSVDNFFLLGQSWGGILAMDYAFEHQEHLKGLIISTMMASIPEYNRYAMEVLDPQLPEEVYEEVMAFESAEDFSNPRYLELVNQHYSCTAQAARASGRLLAIARPAAPAVGSSGSPRYLREPAPHCNVYIVDIERGGMGNQTPLGEFEQLVLLAVLQIGNGAYGVPVRREIERRTGRAVSRGAVYTTLDRLESKGLLGSWLGEPTPQRSGKAKRFYRVERAGIGALKESRTALRSMWAGLETVLGEL